MWRLWNKLFGWDYVLSVFTYRVRKDKRGRVYIKHYEGFSIIVESYSKYSRERNEIQKDDLLWLTCEPEKYLKKDN